MYSLCTHNDQVHFQYVTFNNFKTRKSQLSMMKIKQASRAKLQNILPYMKEILEMARAQLWVGNYASVKPSVVPRLMYRFSIVIVK